MVLKCALVLCLVSVFCCEALVLRPPHYSSYEHYRPYRYYGRPYIGVSLESDESDEDYLQKEYAVASKPDATTYFVSSHNLSWENARDECKSKGMVLASPTSQEQKYDLEVYLEKNSLVPVDQYSGYWIGGKRLSADEPWIWEVDGQEVKSLGWLPGEPNGFDGEDCMEFKYDYISGWNNYYCSALKRFICQSKPHIHETAKNNIKNPQFSHIHEETLKDRFNNVDNTKTKESSDIETTTVPATTTTYQYPAPHSSRFAHRGHMVLDHSRPLFYDYTEEPSSTPETSSEPPSSTYKAQTENSDSTTLENTVQTETSGATETTSKANLESITKTTEKTSFSPTTTERVSTSVGSLSSSERSENMDESSPSSMYVAMPIIRIDDPAFRRYQEREEEMLHTDYMDQTYEDYM